MPRRGRSRISRLAKGAGGGASARIVVPPGYMAANDGSVYSLHLLHSKGVSLDEPNPVDGATPAIIAAKVCVVVVRRSRGRGGGV